MIDTTQTSSGHADQAIAEDGGVPERPEYVRHPVWVLLGGHTPAYMPWLAVAAAEVTGLGAHAAHSWHAQITGAAIAAAIITLIGWVNVVRHKRSRRVRKTMAACFAAWTAWTCAAAYAGPQAGHYHPLQLTLVAGGTVMALWWRNVAGRPAPAPDKAPKALPASVREHIRDPRLLLFQERFTGTGTGNHMYRVFHGAQIAFEVIQGGFRLDITLDPHSDATATQIMTRRVDWSALIAKTYGVPAEQVSIEQDPVQRSEGHVRITVLTVDAALSAPRRCDGVSTYNPLTGTVTMGEFMDGSPMHWRLHTPRSGAAGGVLAGRTGYGKTGAALSLAAEIGIAKMCRTCGAARACLRCQIARIAGLWIGDPQMQPMSVYRGKADLVAWGPKACVLMLLWAEAAMRYRAARLSEVEWADPHGRGVIRGRGWFDPDPRFPLVKTIVDEYPLLLKDPALAGLAIPAASHITQAGRKAGVDLTSVSPLPDQPYLGDRMTTEMLLAFNVGSFKTDGLSRSMLGLEGDTSRLPTGVPGLLYTNGYDRRPGTIARWKELPELRPAGDDGVDARDLADMIAADPIDFGDDIMDAIGTLGYTGHGQVITDDDFDAAMRRLNSQPAGSAAPPVPQQTPAQPVPTAGAVSLDTAARARRALVQAVHKAGGGPAELYDLMGITGMSAKQALDAYSALTEVGEAVVTEDGRYLLPAETP